MPPKRKRRFEQIETDDKVFPFTQILPLEIWEYIYNFCSFWDKMRFRMVSKYSLIFRIKKLPECFSRDCNHEHSKRLTTSVLMGLNCLESLVLKTELPNYNHFTKVTKLKLFSYCRKDLILNMPKLLNLQNTFYPQHVNICDLTNLTKLKAGNWKYGKLHSDLLKLTKLKYLELDNSVIDSLSSLVNLTRLTIKNPLHENLPVDILTNNEKIIELDIGENQQSLNLNNLTNLRSLKCNQFIASNLSENNYNLENLTLQIPIHSFANDLSNLNILTRLTRLELNCYIFPYYLPIEALIHLTNLLEMKRVRMTQFELGHFLNLTKLDITHLEVPQEQIEQLTKLKELHCYNSIKITRIEHLKNLITLTPNSMIENGQLKDLTKLEDLLVNMNFTSLGHLKNLTKLFKASEEHLNRNNFTDFANLLELNWEGIGRLDGIYLPNLTSLDLSLGNSCCFRNPADYLCSFPKLKKIGFGIGGKTFLHKERKKESKSHKGCKEFFQGNTVIHFLD